MSEPSVRASSIPGFGEYKSPRAPRFHGTRTFSAYVPMRDGVRIAVSVVLPRDLSSGDRLPALMAQTRYWRETELNAPFRWFMAPEAMNPKMRGFRPFFTSHGYAIVLVDVRGTGASFGAWPHPWPKDSLQDAGELVDWIVAQPWSDGRVASYGVSYVGTTAEFLAMTERPAVKAIMPMFNHPDAFADIAFPGGLYDRRFIYDWGNLDSTLDHYKIPREFGPLGRLFMKGVKPVDGDRGRRLLNEAILQHMNNGNVDALARGVVFRDVVSDAGICLDDVAVHPYNDVIQRSGVAIYSWASWQDAGTCDAALRRLGTCRNPQWAAIGAWSHGAQMQASPFLPADAPVSPSLPAQWEEMLRFFDRYVKGVDDGESDRVVNYYTLGEEVWKKSDQWPPAGASNQTWYMGEGRVLLPRPPAEETGDDVYDVDFGATSGMHTRWWEMGAIQHQTVAYPDRARGAGRLLSYSSPPLEQDTEIAGHPVVTLYLSSTMPDFGLFAYLEDVSPSGRVTYVTEGQLRSIHRKLTQAPYVTQMPYHSCNERDALPLAPGEVAEFVVGMQPTSVLIRKGHRIRISIAGADKDTFTRVPQEGTPVLTVERHRTRASHVDLPVVSRR